MIFLDTLSGTWVLLMLVPIVRLSERIWASMAASMGGLDQLDAYLRALYGGNLLRTWRGQPPYQRPTFAPNTRLLGYLVLPQSTPDLRKVQAALWSALLWFGVAAIVGWVVALTFASYVTLDRGALRALQALLVVALGAYCLHQVRLPASRRQLPRTYCVMALAVCVAILALTLLPAGQ